MCLKINTRLFYAFIGFSLSVDISSVIVDRCKFHRKDLPVNHNLLIFN